MNIIVEYNHESTLNILKELGNIIYKSRFSSFIYLKLKDNVSINRISTIPGVIHVEEKSLQIM